MIDKICCSLDIRYCARFNYILKTNTWLEFSDIHNLFLTIFSLYQRWLLSRAPLSGVFTCFDCYTPCVNLTRLTIMRLIDHWKCYSKDASCVHVNLAIVTYIFLSILYILFVGFMSSLLQMILNKLYGPIMSFTILL